MKVSPTHGYIESVFYVDASQSEIDLVNVLITVSSGDIQVVNINYANQVISIRLTDIVNGTKTILFTDGTITEMVDVILEIPHNPETRESYTIQDSKRPKWPYRTY